MAQATHDALCIHEGDPTPNPSTRAERARVEEMVVIPVTNDDGVCTGQYRVKTHGGFYTTNLIGQWCSCPDDQHNAGTCKHRRRVAMMLNDEDSHLPAPRDPLTDAFITEFRELVTTLEATVRVLRGKAENGNVTGDGRVSLKIRAEELEELAGVAKTALVKHMNG